MEELPLARRKAELRRRLLHLQVRLEVHVLPDEGHDAGPQQDDVLPQVLVHLVSKVPDPPGSGELADELGDVAPLGLGGELVVELVRPGHVPGIPVVGRHVEGVGPEALGPLALARRQREALRELGQPDVDVPVGVGEADVQVGKPHQEDPVSVHDRMDGQVAIQEGPQDERRIEAGAGVRQEDAAAEGVVGEEKVEELFQRAPAPGGPALVILRPLLHHELGGAAFFLAVAVVGLLVLVVGGDGGLDVEKAVAIPVGLLLLLLLLLLLAVTVVVVVVAVVGGGPLPLLAA